MVSQDFDSGASAWFDKIAGSDFGRALARPRRGETQDAFHNPPLSGTEIYQGPDKLSSPKNDTLYKGVRFEREKTVFAGVVYWLLPQPSKLMKRVRFPPPAPEHVARTFGRKQGLDDFRLI